VAEGYQILTRAEFAPYLERFDNVPRPSRVSGPALETLAIIAYRQPLGRVEMEYIRGVGSSGVIRTLQDRQLIEVVGRAEGLGRPLLYGTTKHFLEHFGFRSLEDLPRPEELPVILRDRVPLGPPEGEGDEEEAQEELVLEGGETAPESDAMPDETPGGEADAETPGGDEDTETPGGDLDDETPAEDLDEAVTVEDSDPDMSEEDLEDDVTFEVSGDDLPAGDEAGDLPDGDELDDSPDPESPNDPPAPDDDRRN